VILYYRDLCFPATNVVLKTLRQTEMALGTIQITELLNFINNIS